MKIVANDKMIGWFMNKNSLCEYCYELFEESDLIYDTISNENVCKSCMDILRDERSNDTFQCEYCSKHVDISEKHEINADEYFDGEYLCEECYESYMESEEKEKEYMPYGRRLYS